MSTPEVIKFMDGDVYMWLDEASCIMLKAIDRGDPVELTSDEARQIGKALLSLADQLE